jgi:superfamily II DNA/RNA helicase
MEKAGKRVVVITGSDSAKEKDSKRRMFNPEHGEAQADILIASDAGAVGMNLQSGQFLIQHDVPMTAKTHSQRAARIHRLGQKQGIELIDDGIGLHMKLDGGIAQNDAEGQGQQGQHQDGKEYVSHSAIS